MHIVYVVYEVGTLASTVIPRPHGEEGGGRTQLFLALVV